MLSRGTPRYLILGLGKIFFTTSLRKGLEAKGLDFERYMTHSVFLAFNKILLAFSHVVRVLRSITFEQRDRFFLLQNTVDGYRLQNGSFQKI